MHTLFGARSDDLSNPGRLHMIVVLAAVQTKRPRRLPRLRNDAPRLKSKPPNLPGPSALLQPASLGRLAAKKPKESAWWRSAHRRPATLRHAGCGKKKPTHGALRGTKPTLRLTLLAGAFQHHANADLVCGVLRGARAWFAAKPVGEVVLANRRARRNRSHSAPEAQGHPNEGFSSVAYEANSPKLPGLSEQGLPRDGKELLVARLHVLRMNVRCDGPAARPRDGVGTSDHAMLRREGLPHTLDHAVGVGACSLH
mmetsp:Transcript_59617/g.182062  ORF Transcript_59617/g.182062 Transcript_59617/m.182062 type:complete len:255 (-) Transcript_59617:511-1275(-)